VSNDSFSEVTSESWFGRLGGAIKGVFFGLILLVISFPLLWWNEGRAVRTAKGLREAGGAVVSVTADKVDPANDKKLVHMTALATTDETLHDSEFAVSVPAVKLHRKVEMYQWQQKESSQTRKKLGGGSETTKTYSYEKTWAGEPIDSSRFHPAEGQSETHVNPAAMRFPERKEEAKLVKLGAFALSPGLVAEFNSYEAVPIDQKVLDKLPGDASTQARLEQNTIYLSNDPKRAAPEVNKPEIGDLRITFEAVKPATVSILARQAGGTFEAWPPAAGSAIERLTVGTASAENMIGQMEKENTILTWILRAVGFLLMALGIGMVFSPLAVLADVLPFLGDLLRMGVGLFAGAVAASLSLVTIAIAWLAYRPVLGIGLMVVAAGLFVGLKRLGRGKRPAVPAAPVEPASR
jgi:hypothetical protein